MELNAATEPAPQGRVERESGWGPPSGEERRGLPPLQAAAGLRCKACGQRRGGVRYEPHEAAADAVSGGSATDGRRGEGGGVDGWRKAEQEARGGVAWCGAAVVVRAGAGAAGGGSADGAQQGVPGSVVAREGWRGGGEVGTKRQPAAPPTHHPPPKRMAVSAGRQFPPGFGRDAAAPLGRADGGARFRAAARADDACVARDNAAPAPRPPLAVCDAIVLPTAESVSPFSTDGALSVAKGARYVPVARLLAKRRTVSGRRSLPPGCGRDAVPLLAVELLLRVEPGRADDGLGVPEEMAAAGDRAVAVEGGMDVVATPMDGPIDGAEVQGEEELEDGVGEIPAEKVHPVAQEHLGSQVAVHVTLHQSAVCGDRTVAMEAPVCTSTEEKISGSRIQRGEKRLSCEIAKDFKVMNGSPSQEHLRGTREMDKASSDASVRGSGEGAAMRSKVMFTPRKTVRPGKLSHKSAVGTQHAPFLANRDKENELGGHVSENEIESSKGPVQQAPTSSEKSFMTQGKMDVKITGYFGPRKRVKVNDPANLPIKIYHKCELGGKENNLDGDDILKGLAVREGKLELHLKNPSHVPSMKWQRQYGVQSADVIRNKVKMMCRRFEAICRAIAQAVDQRSLKIRRIDLAADKAMKELPDYFKAGPFVGKVPGVEVGDGFLYRVQLAIVGLHRPYQGGIDSTNDNNGNFVAISVVASGGYPDERSNSGDLVYTGSGGKLAGRNASGDQKLERGNLALKNCIERKSPVRVIHGFKGQNEEASHSRAREITTFTYDGLYHVVGCWREGEPGSKVFKFKLQRIPGQPELPNGRKARFMS